jgi:hypothetical protein
MNFDVVDIELLRDHSPEQAQFGPSPSDRGITSDVKTADDEVIAADLHLTHGLKRTIRRDHIDDEIRVLRIFGIDDKLDIVRFHADDYVDCV